MRYWWLMRNLLQLCVGILAVVLVIWLLGYGNDRQAERRAPAGWSLQRAPGNLQTVVVVRDEVWAGGIGGLFRFDRKTAAALELPAGTPRLTAVNALLADESDRLWVACDQGLLRYDGSRWETMSGRDGLAEGPVMALLIARDGAVWLGRDDGVVQYFPGNSARLFGRGDGLAMGPATVLYQDRTDRVWAGSSDAKHGGLAAYDGNKWRSYGLADGLVHLSVTSITETKDGSLWIGSGFGSSGGANKLTADGLFAPLLKKDGLAGDKVRYIYEDNQGLLWFCSEYDGVAMFAGGRVQRILTTADGLAGQEVKKVVQDVDGAYWLATDQGLNRIVKL